MANRFLIVCGGSGVKLLGQRRVLGFEAELQIDVKSEIVSHKTNTKFPALYYVELDKPVGTTTAALLDLQNHRLSSKPQRENVTSEYLQETIVDERDRAHLEFLSKYYAHAASLEFGLAQSPAIGKAAIWHPKNVEALRQRLADMFTKHAQTPGPENPVEVWIVSSTAGGTGEGTHRYVAVEIAHYFQSLYPEAPVRLNFVRVGQGTYNSVGRTQTALNTFFGIAADAALTLKAKEEFPRATFNWFYVELPDVGVGEGAKRIRAEMVEIAAKAIMLENLQEDLNKLLVNNFGAPMVVARTGFWGRDFDDNLKYYETLRQLTSKLRSLVEPDYRQEFIQDRPQPSFVAPELDRLRDKVSNAEQIAEAMNNGWSFPRVRRSMPTSKEELSEMVKSWKKSVEHLLGRTFREIDHAYYVTETRLVGEDQSTRESVRVRLTVPPKIEEGSEWFEGIWQVHRALAWARHLLGISYDGKEIRGDGLLAKLFDTAKEISDALYSLQSRLLQGSSKRAQAVASVMGDFLTLLLQATHLLELEGKAQDILEEQLDAPREVLKWTIEEMELAKSVLGSAASAAMIEAADLNTVLDRLRGYTWLQMLTEAVRRGNRELFRERVMQGAVGLTELGLRNVLGLNEQAGVAEIQSALASSVGRMQDADGDTYEAPWWGATEPNATLRYEYRILPKVSRSLQAKLHHQQEVSPTDFRYVFTEIGMIGLYVLAFQGVSLNRESGDYVSAPAYLMSPFTEIVRSTLKRWVDNPDPNTPSGQLDIVRAGACGEYLYERALRAVGLTDEEIEKIGQFYKLLS